MMKTLTASHVKKFGSYFPIINEHKTMKTYHFWPKTYYFWPKTYHFWPKTYHFWPKTYHFWPKTVQFCTKLASSSSYDNNNIMLHYARRATYCLPISNSEGGLETETMGNEKLVCVKFQLEKECGFGDHFYLVGNDPILGSWNPSNAIPFNWSEGHIWSLLLELPTENSIQYKFLLKKSTGEMLWQPGPDRSFQPWETDNVIIVTEEWDNAEAQKISEEKHAIKENGEVEYRNLVEPSVINSVENHKDENIISVSSRSGDSGSDKNATKKDENGANLTENPSSGAVKKSKGSDRKFQKKEVALRKRTKVDNYSAVIEDEGNLVTHDEGPVLVPGLTLPVSSSDEAAAQENQKSVLAEN